MPKFFAKEQQIKGGQIILAGEDAWHIARALRGRPGDTHIIGDGAGRDYECEIADVNKERVVFDIKSASMCQTEPNLAVTLYQALPKLDKMDFIIQKCVELGVAEIVPVVTDNTVIKVTTDFNKRRRWQKIAESAAMQSMRGVIPEVREIITLKEAIMLRNREEMRFVPYENERANGIKELLQSWGYIPRSAGFFIGPEGGFSPSEVMLFEEYEVDTVTLGPRVFRTETAGMAALAMLMYEYEL